MDLNSETWEFKYAPKNFDDLILPQALKDTFNNLLNKNTFKNVLLYSTKPGTGKTSITRILTESNKFATMFINASRETSIDNIRYNARKFATTTSLAGEPGAPKLIFLDEADRLSGQALDSLKAEIELTIKNARWIFSTNRIAPFDEAILSRVDVYDFNQIFIQNKKEMYHQAYDRLKIILDSENVKYEKPSLIKLIKKYAPDWRNLIKTCQLLAEYNNEILDSDIEKLDVKNEIEYLIESLKAKDFHKVREFAIKHQGNEQEVIRSLFDLSAKNSPYLKDTSKPSLILELAEFEQFYNAVADPEILLASTLIKLLMNMEFNDDK